MRRLYLVERNGIAKRDFVLGAHWDRLDMLRSSGRRRVWEAGEVQRRKACLCRDGSQASQRRIAYVYDIVN
jgi:hypothetical protein